MCKMWLFFCFVYYVASQNPNSFITRREYTVITEYPELPSALLESIEKLRDLIRSKIEESTTGRNKKNAGTFIRALVHDCAHCYVANRPDSGPRGCCDGCVDYAEAFNVGLEERAFEGWDDFSVLKEQGMKQWYQEWVGSCPDADVDENVCYEWTRADFIAACANIAIEYAIGQIGGIEAINAKESNEEPLEYPTYYFGREDCQTSVTFADPIPARDFNPGYRHDEFFPDAAAHLWDDVVVDFFEKQFGLTESEAVALMSGGHNLGVGHDDKEFDSGFRDKWKYRNSEFDQGYPKNLLKESWDTDTDTSDAIINPLQYVKEKSDGSTQRLMLNVDISMLYDIDKADPDHFDSDVNEIQCEITGTNEDDRAAPSAGICPYSTDRHTQIQSYTKNKKLSGESSKINAHYRFTRDFLRSYDLMTQNGYDDLYAFDASATNVPAPTQMPTNNRRL